MKSHAEFQRDMQRPEPVVCSVIPAMDFNVPLEALYILQSFWVSIITQSNNDKVGAHIVAIEPGCDEYLNT